MAKKFVHTMYDRDNEYRNYVVFCDECAESYINQKGFKYIGSPDEDCVNGCDDAPREFPYFN